MPITERDVKRYNKEAAKKNPGKFVGVFNGAYDACKKSGGKLAKDAGMSGCDEYAARTANARWK
ncbi:hypothetical protein ES703_57690 [subsurface metagenome]